jgi:protein-S-isoprenylcysteine O-methyltransferase Ste14
VLLVPGAVAGCVPWTIARGDAGPLAGAVVPGVLGGLLIAAGWAILLWCTRDFVRRGRGTPAPHDPPRALVTAGLYGVVRNPMYVGVLLAIGGIALRHWSARALLYGAFVALAFHLRVLLYEEPRLARDFGAAWAAYRRAVPRWIPTWRGTRRDSPVAEARSPADNRS